METAHVEWCKNLYASLAEGGTWAVPRSGLVFEKRDGGLRLVASLGPVGPAIEDFETIVDFFAAAGIEVRRFE